MFAPILGRWPAQGLRGVSGKVPDVETEAGGSGKGLPAQ